MGFPRGKTGLELTISYVNIKHQEAAPYSHLNARGKSQD